MISEKRSIPCRLLLCLLVCLILFYSCVVPVRASAVLLEVLAASARSMIASVVRACGVYVADGLASEMTEAMNNFESLTDSILSYVWERLPDNLKLVNAAGTLMLKMVFQNGIYYAPRTIVELVCQGLTQKISDAEYIDFATQLGFQPTSESDISLFNDIFNGANDRYGDAASFVDSYDFQYCYFVHVTPFTVTDTSIDYTLNPILLFTNDTSKIKIKQSGDYVSIRIASNTPFSILSSVITSGGGSDPYVSAGCNSYDFACTLDQYCTLIDYYTIERQSGSSGTSDSSLEGLSLEDDVATIRSSWDAKSITVTDKKLDTAAVTVVPVSVYPSSSAATATRSEVTAGTVVDAETATVEEDVLGDTTTETGFWNSLLSWLDRILTAIKSLIGGITTPIVNSLSQVIAAVKSAAVAITDALTLKFGTVDSYKLELTSFFPFCIPFDLYDMLAAFVAEPEAPVFTFATGFLGNVYTVDIDLSPWDSVAKTVRAIQLCICIVGLAFATRKFIKW